MRFSTETHHQKIDKPWGNEIIYTPKDYDHTGKILSIAAGRRLSLQYHDQKNETLCLVSGRAVIWLENERGVIEEIEMQHGRGYAVIPGQKHRLQAISDAVIIEVSDPEKGNTFRVSDDYSRPDETEQLRASNNRGWRAADAAAADGR